MDNGNSVGDVLRLIGFMAVCVGLAWALQILGFGDVSAFNRLVWVMGAAAIAGAGAGAILTARSLQPEEASIRG